MFILWGKKSQLNNSIGFLDQNNYIVNIFKKSVDKIVFQKLLKPLKKMLTFRYILHRLLILLISTTSAILL